MRRTPRRWWPRHAPPGRHLIEGFHYRFHPLFERALTALRRGAIGRIRHIEAVFNAICPTRPANCATSKNWAAARSWTSAATACTGSAPLRRRTHRGQRTRALRDAGRRHRHRSANSPSPAGRPRRSNVRCSRTTASCFAACASQGDQGVLEIDNPVSPHAGATLSIESANASCRRSSRAATPRFTTSCGT